MNTRSSLSRPAAFLAAALMLLSSPFRSAAVTVSVDFHDAGFFGSDGRNSKEDAEALGASVAPGGFANYHVGLSDGYSAPPFPDIEMRNYFVFDWSEVLTALGGSLPGPITSATLSLYNPGVTPDGADGYLSISPSETYRLSDIGPLTPAAVMDHYDHPFYGLSGGKTDESGAAMMIYDELGVGPEFGTATVSAADNGSYVDIAITPAGLGYLNSMLSAYDMGGGDVHVAMSGRLTTITPGVFMDGGIDSPYEEIFAFTHPGTVGSPSTAGTPPVLTLTFIPEPGSALLVCAGMLLAAGRRRRPAPVCPAA